MDFDEFELIDRIRYDLESYTRIRDVFKLSLLQIRGVEVTQAIQYHRSSQHLTDAADRMPDNSVTLVAGKPAWVRVYVRSGQISNIPGVTGTLEVSKRSMGFLYNNIATIAPEAPGSVVAKHSPYYAVERSTLGDTLNFILPADLMCGHLRLTVKIHNSGSLVAEKTIDLDVTLRQQLRLAGIMVGYNGPTSTAPGASNLVLAAPTIANMQTTSAWTLLTFPVNSTATYRSAGTINWNLPLTDPPTNPGGCSPNWLALNAAVQAQRVADGNHTDVLYYGLMAVGIPMGPVIGCNSSGVSTGANNNGVTMAHELGHACGLPHAPCGTPGDPNYPAYEPYDPANTPQASIGEYGLDISNGTIMSPTTFKDMMSYCGPRWISLYNYGRLTNNTNLDPGRSCMDHPWWRDIVLYDPQLIPEKWLPDPPPDPEWRKRVSDPEPIISIIGVVHSETEIEIKSIMRLSTGRTITSGRSTSMVAELLGAENKVLARTQLHSLGSLGDCGCGGSTASHSSYPYLFQAFVPNVAAGAAIRIRQGERSIWERRAPGQEPRIAKFAASIAQGTGKKKEEREALRLLLEWQLSVEKGSEPECWAQWSDDRGTTWRALSTGLRGESALLDLADLPSGRIMVRLLVSDGFHTAESKGVAVEIPKHPAAVSILSPRDGQTLITGNPMRLLGAVTQPEAKQAAIKARWSIDGKAVAEGLDAFVTTPKAGTHTLTLEATIGNDTVSQSLRFQSIALPSEGERKA